MRWRQKPGRAVACYHDDMTAVFASPPEPGTKPQYPFAEWLNGRHWVLTKGRDYWGDPEAMIRSIEASARARRLRMRCHYDFDTRCIHVQAVQDSNGEADT